VKNRLMQGKHWRTFHDFLCDYIKLAIGPAWGKAEIAKPTNERHPILNWYQSMCATQATRPKKPGEVVGMQMTGAIAAYMGLAYDLYAIDHNAFLQDRLLARLRNRDNFWGARYELFVAAIFVRAGFDIEFENEDDGSTTHCEFTATHRQTGNRFSVEASVRNSRGFESVACSTVRCKSGLTTSGLFLLTPTSETTRETKHGLPFSIYV